MSIYFIIYFIILIFCFIDLNSKSLRAKKILVSILAVIFILLAGLRWDVGTDWGQYLWFFNIIHLTEIGGSGHEFFYDLLLRLVALFTDSYTGVLLLTAVLIVSLTFNTLRKYSLYPVLSILLLYSYSINSIGFGYRQDIAIAITFFSYRYIKERKIYKFLLCIYCAMQFHQTAIIFVFAYWIYTIQWTYRYMVILILTLGLGYLLTSQLTFIASLYTSSSQDKLSHYMADTNETYGAGIDATTLFLRGLANRIFLVILPLFFIFKNKNQRVEELKSLYNLFLFGFLIFMLLGSVAVVFIRFGRYFDIFQLLVIPLTYHLSSKKHKLILLLLLLAYISVKFSMVIISDQQIYVPYKTCFE